MCKQAFSCRLFQSLSKWGTKVNIWIKQHNTYNIILSLLIATPGGNDAVKVTQENQTNFPQLFNKIDRSPISMLLKHGGSM